MVEDPWGDLVGEVGMVVAWSGGVSGVVVVMPLRPDAKEDDGVVLGEAIILDGVGWSLASVRASYVR